MRCINKNVRKELKHLEIAKHYFVLIVYIPPLFLQTLRNISALSTRSKIYSKFLIHKKLRTVIVDILLIRLQILRDIKRYAKNWISISIE